MNHRIGVCYGTRPEWLKVRPVIQELEHRGYDVYVCRVEQHDTLFKDDDFADAIIPVAVDAQNRLSSIVASVMIGGDFSGCDVVLVQGDTASAFACALAAFQQGIPVGHIEAGLRSYDLGSPYPEEGYRTMIGAIADFHFCPTGESYENCIAERPHAEVFMTGNTSLDNLRKYGLPVTDSGTVLVTMHRRENRGNALVFAEFLADVFADETFAPEVQEILWVTHPGVPEISVESNTLEGVCPRMKVVPPMSHYDFCKILSGCTFVITDSGGLVEESSFYGKMSIVTREATERSEAISSGHSLLYPPSSLDYDSFESIVAKVLGQSRISYPCPFGDGYAAKSIVDNLGNYLENV